ncbi:hypothetical protein HERIO_661 [Hepatospora eriocheir]|uniref:Uncharacterized protein n=1 Tax=Hepatospora eriocheir TaxID=1081669 RepID=A0A1X0QCF2_9MICR|nr:hypothetical protein HERIO_661 [Hepatospora eriocheir]
MFELYEKEHSLPLPNFNHEDFQIINEIITMIGIFSNRKLKTILIPQCHFELLQSYSKKFKGEEGFKNLKDDNEKVKEFKLLFEDYLDNKDKEKFKDLNTYLIKNYINSL